MVVCLTGARFNMKADVLRATPTSVEDSPGNWVTTQDPDSGELIRSWQVNPVSGQVDDASTDTLESFSCIVRGIVSGGIRVAGTTERFGEYYNDVDFVTMQFPASVKLSRRDRITNIRDSKGNIIWWEEERLDGAPTIFSVNGVTPVVDPFGNHIENTAILSRSETQ